MQIRAKADELCELVEEHEALLLEAIADGRLDAQERTRLKVSAAKLRSATERQALRVRLGVRMMRGGGLDREIGQDIADYARLLDEEKAGRVYGTRAA